MNTPIRITLLILFSFLLGCKGKDTETKTYDYEDIVKKDTLRVATLYGSSSYFILKGEEMGFDYELCKKFADDNNLTLSLTVANSLPELINLLENKQIDLIAYRLAITNERKKAFLYTNNEYITKQVLVQRAGKKELSNVVELLGKDVYVNIGSKYEERIKNLNEELGGGINIKTSDDSISVDDMIEMVSNGTIDYTIAENDIALLNKTYFRNIDCKLAVSFSQRAAWAVSKSTPKLQEAINQWFDSKVKRNYYKSLENKYFVQAKYFGNRNIKIPRGSISPYDPLFKHYAQMIHWDWHLLAAVGHEESRFDSSAVSWIGARGIMQLMPRTAGIFGLTEKDIANPEKNIEASVKYFKKLSAMFSEVENKEERIKFILAAYNAGPSHVQDAMALAEKYGKERTIWYGHVEEYLLLKSQREYYTDTVVKSGYFRGTQTVRYVTNVLHTYERYKRKH